MFDLLVGWPGGSLESALKLLALLLIAYALVLWLSAVVWVYRDVRNRTMDQTSQMIAVILVAVFNLPGLIVYLVIRPQGTMGDSYERSVEAEAILAELQLASNACQTCRRPIEDEYVVCPWCRSVLREACRSCGKSVRTAWMACPYCTADRVPLRPQPVPHVRGESGELIPPRRSPAQQQAQTRQNPPRRPPVAPRG
jgi:RNA polymerase subunit RPABC4/transcription elongation factor Spt4